MGGSFNEEVRNAQLGMTPTPKHLQRIPVQCSQTPAPSGGGSLQVWTPGAFWAPSSSASSGILGFSQ